MSKVTFEELKQHCIKTIEACEQIKRIPNVRITDDRRSQEHKLVLQLIEEHEQRQSTDAVSREEALKEMQKYHDDCAKTSEYTRLGFETAMNVVRNLPPVTPERPKGKWVDGICNKCGYDGGVEAISGKANYCSICGSDMRGVSE